MIRRMIMCLAIVFLVFACGRKSPPKYVFLLTLDTTREDAVDMASGNPDTPNLAALAARGRTWTQAFCLTPITLPSHLNMLYSLPPHLLKVYNNGQVKKIPHPSLAQLMQSGGYKCAAAISLGVLKRDFGTAIGFDMYAENFRPNLWYRNAAEVTDDAIQALDRFRDKPAFFWFHYSDPHEPYFPPKYNERFRILQGDREIHSHPSIEQPRVKVSVTIPPGRTSLIFDTEIPPEFKDSVPPGIRYISFQDFSAKPDPEANEKVQIKLPPHWRRARHSRQISYLSSRFRSPLTIVNGDSRPRTVRISFIYRMLEQPDIRHDLYREQVRYMDGQIGRLLKAVQDRGMMDDAVFLVIGDHGEGMGEYRNHFGHIHYLNPVYTRVPLILAGKGISRSEASTDLVSTLDVAPTLLKLAGIRVPAFMEGTSLTEEIPERRLVLETYSPEAYFDAFSIIAPPWQITHYPGRAKEKMELVNLEKDPLGLENLFETTADRKARTELFNAILKISRVLTASKGRAGHMDKRHEEILKSLGYL